MFGNSGAALVGAHGVGVVTCYVVGDVGGGGMTVCLFTRRDGGGGRCLVDSL